MSRSRKLLALVGLLALGFAGAVFFGSRQVAARAGRVLADRLDMQADVGGASLSLDSVSLRELVLRGKHDGLVVRFDRVEAHASPWAVALGGVRSVDRAQVSGVDVEIDLAAPHIEESIDEIRKLIRPRTTQTTNEAQADRSATRKDRAFRAKDVRVRVRDAHGPLVEVAVASVEKRSAAIELELRSALVGNENADHIDLGASDATLSREDGAWKIASASVGATSARWLGNADGGEPLVRRLSAARKVFTGRTFARDHRADKTHTDDDRLANNPTPNFNDEHHADSPTLDSNHDATQTATDSGEEDQNQTTTDSREKNQETSSTHPWLNRLATGAQLRAGPIHIESKTGLGRVETIDDLQVELLDEGGGWVRSKGDGRGTGDSSLRWNVRVHPSDLRGEGKVAFEGISLALLAPFVPAVPLHEPEAATLRGDLTLTTVGTGAVEFQGDLDVSGLGLFSERIAPEPIEGLNVAASGAGVWDARTRQLTARALELRLGDAALQLTGMFQGGRDDFRAEVVATVPPIPCNQIVQVIPSSVLGKFRRFAWTGTWSLQGNLQIDSRDLDSTTLSVRPLNGCKFVAAPWIAKAKRFRKRFTHRVEEPDGEIFRMTTGPGTPNWTPLASISPFLQEAVVAHEDAGFYKHRGIAVYAIRDALVRNIREGRYAVGASTISMQLAKNLFLHRDKTIARKVQETILTWWLETEFDKEDILELYLNVIEYGPAIYGVRNASRQFFSRAPADLSPAEAAYLACVLPSPKKYAFFAQQNRLSSSMKTKMRRLLEHMHKRDLISEEALLYGKVELENFQFHAPDGPPPPPRVLPKAQIHAFDTDEIWELGPGGWEPIAPDP